MASSPLRLRRSRQHRSLLFSCLSLLNLLIEICIQKLSCRPAARPPCLAIWFWLNKVCYIIFTRAQTWRKVFFLPLNLQLREATRLAWPKLRSGSGSQHMTLMGMMAMMRMTKRCGWWRLPRWWWCIFPSNSWSQQAVAGRSLSHFLLSLSFCYNLQSCPVNLALDLHLADVGVCFVAVRQRERAYPSRNPHNSNWASSFVLCCYLQRAWADTIATVQLIWRGQWLLWDVQRGECATIDWLTDWLTASLTDRAN